MAIDTSKFNQRTRYDVNGVPQEITSYTVPTTVSDLNPIFVDDSTLEDMRSHIARMEQMIAPYSSTNLTLTLPATSGGTTWSDLATTQSYDQFMQMQRRALESQLNKIALPGDKNMTDTINDLIHKVEELEHIIITLRNRLDEIDPAIIL